jgi:hypothetical protein
MWRSAAAGRWMGLWLGLAVLQAGAGPSWAQESLSDVLGAFNEVAQKGAEASGRAQAMAFKHNETLQHLSILGKVPDNVYQANQANFSRINGGLIQQAATQNGLSYRPQQTKAGHTPTPGADTDALVSSGQPGKPMTAQQVSNARGSYNQNVQNFLNQNGVGGGQAPNTNTSIMPEPQGMDRSEWQKAIDEADRAGEVVYKNPLAAAAEAKIRAGQPLSVSEAQARVQEVGRLANEHFAKANQLDAAARAAPPGPQRQALEAQAQIARHNGAKYVSRITETGQAMAGQAGVKPVAPSSGTVGAASVRGADNKVGAAAAGAMSEHFTAEATKNFIQNMANAAKASGNPQVVAQSEKAIAQALQGLSPSAQGNVLEALRASNGDQFARNVAQTARTLPKPPPGAPGGPAAPGKLNTALKYLGPAMILYGGAKDIYGVATAADPSHEAGKRLGGFTVGTAGGLAGAYVGGKAGGLIGGTIGSLFGPAGTVIGGGVGAVVGGLVGGVGGYIYGSGHGTEMGDTNSKYWDKNKSDAEFNKLAAANTLKTPDEVMSTLIGMGVAPDRARALAEIYRSGSLGVFRDALRGLREEMIKNGKWSPKAFKHFNQLTTNEIPELLHCLCSASLGANPWVAQGYNLTIPADADPKAHSCGSLKNGPCMASGFGCWRSFMNLTSPEAKKCFESVGLAPTRENIAAVHRGYQQQYVEPFKSELVVEPLEVCPGDKVQVTMRTQGGMGNYQYQYEVGSWPLQRPEGMPDFHTPTSSGSFTLTVDPTLKRGFYDGHWVYTRPAEHYNTYVRVLAHTHTFEAGEWQDVTVNRIVTVRLRPHAECEKLKPPPEPPEKKPSPPKKPVVSPGVPVPPAVVPSGRGPAVPSEVSAPPPGAPPPAGVVPPSTGVPSTAGKGQGGGKQSDQPEGGGGAASGGDGKGAPAGPKSGKAPGWGTQKGWGKGGAAGKSAGEVAGQPPAKECQLGGGGYGTDQGDMVMFAEVPSSNRVRITIVGSDGYSRSAEGVRRAELTRPLSPNGHDTITVEDLDTPGCREVQQRSYDAKGMPVMESPFDTNAPPASAGDLKGAEGEILATPDGAFGPAPVETYGDTRVSKSSAATKAGMGLMDAQNEIRSASTAADQTLRDAGRLRDQAGAAALDTSSRSAGKTATKDAQSGWGATLSDSLSQGLQQGLSQAASAFGAAAGERVAGEIFDDGHDHDAEGGSAGASAVAGGGGAAVASTPKSSKKAGSSKGGHDHKEGDDHGEILVTPDSADMAGGSSGSKAVSVTCPACGETSIFPDGVVSPWCPKCCAGPYSTQCATCGYKYCGKSGPPPACCPNCGTCGSGPAPEALVPPGDVQPGDILVSPADPGAGGTPLDVVPPGGNIAVPPGQIQEERY